MIYFLAGALGVLGSMISHDLGAQSLRDRRLRPLAGTCPRCGTDRGWAKWSCPSCGRRIGREWVVAAAGVGGLLAMESAVGRQWALIAFAGFVFLSLALALTDLDQMRIVNRLNIPGTLALIAVLGGTAAVDHDLDDFGRALLGALAYFALTNLMFLAARGRAFGYGDVKLSVQLGLFTTYLSWITLVWAVFLMAVIGGIVSIIVIAIGAIRRHDRGENGEESALRRAMRREVPYGPAMIGGAWLAIYLVGIGVLGS